MTIIMVEGKPRTGKTLLITAMGYDAHLLGHEVMANYTLKFPYKYVEPIDMIKIPFDDVDRHPKTLLIQEADKIFDSWSKSNENRLLSSLAGQSGKRNLNIFYDTQFPSRIQKSLRQVTEYTIHTFAFVDDNKNAVAFQYQIIDLYEYERNPFYKPHTNIIPATVMQKYYSLYNTYQPTKPSVKGKTAKELKELLE